MDSGQYHKAYGLLAESQRAQEKFDRFSKRVGEFNTQAGAVKERQILAITWTKDPANAPAPGVYACGYIMLYQSDASAPFRVMRQEDNFITNKDARQIAMKQSPLAVDESWSKLSRNCPNYGTAAARKLE